MVSTKPADWLTAAWEAFSLTIPPLTNIEWMDTCRLIPARYSMVGIFDQVAKQEDLELILQLESWTNDRVRTEFGNLHRIPKSEWVSGKPFSSVVMGSFCHASPLGGRFNSRDRGAWYAARTLETALAEIAYHRTKDLLEVHVTEAVVQMRLFQSDFSGEVHDARPLVPENEPIHNSQSYVASQTLAVELLADRANGIIYRSVRYPGGECLACFRPKMVENVRAGHFYEFRWEGFPVPKIRPIRASHAGLAT